MVQSNLTFSLIYNNGVQNIVNIKLIIIQAELWFSRISCILIINLSKPHSTMGDNNIIIFHFLCCSKLLVKSFSDSCDLVGKIASIIVECNPEYSTTKEDRKSYFAPWVYEPWNLTQQYIDRGSPFVHKSQLELDSLPIYGHFSFYSGSGYVVLLPDELEDAKQIVEDLKTNNWVNLYSRAIIVEFTVYNANIDLFSNVLLLFEMPPAGGTVTMFFIDTFRVYSSVGSLGGVAMVCELAVIVVVIYFIIKVTRGVLKERKAFFRNLSNLVEFLQVILSCTAVVLFVSRQLLTSQALKTVFAAKGRYTLCTV